MKKFTIITLVFAAGAAAAAAEKPIPSVPMRERVSHDTLAQRFAKQDKSIKARAAKPKPKASTARSEEWKPVNILERSEFLSYRGLVTLVPKGALLNVPATLASRNRIEKDGRFVRWEEFLRNNRNWIDTFEVSRRQAEAEVPISEDALESISKNPRVVVATLSGGPITVLRRAPEGAEQTASVAPNAGITKTQPNTPEK